MLSACGSMCVDVPNQCAYDQGSQDEQLYSNCKIIIYIFSPAGSHAGADQDSVSLRFVYAD